MTLDHLALRERRANGLPVEPDAAPRHWATRVLRSPWTWITLGATLVYAACLAWMYVTITRDVPVQGGTIPGINLSAIRRSAGLALPTLAVWVALFWWVDRYRPLRPLLWYLALGWGACVSTAASMVVNTWAAQEMAIVGDGDPTQGARSAVFVAPFVEEATKATIVFVIAMALRYRVVSRLQAVSLGGLSAAGFAFTENILYYSRVIVFASTTISTGDPEAALREIVMLRGLKTAFGHPLFTTFTAVGVVIALRTRSKVVRVVAPLVGFLMAAGSHMIFNFMASTGVPPDFMAISGWLVALGVIVHLVRQLFGEGRRHRARLGDYVAMGWLPEEMVERFAPQRTRWASALISLTYGWRVFLATLRIQRTMSELVYLRDAQVRGTVDAAGDSRARELLDRAQGLAAIAITDPKTQKIQLPQLPKVLSRLRRRRTPPPELAWAPPGVSPAQGPPSRASVPVGSPEYSPVDPRWGPPKG